MTQDAYFTKLKARGKLTLSGADVKPFLQGLITNDINQLDTQDSIYACLLTPQGKFLYDFFITQKNNKIIMDCEGNERAESLAKHLTMYKLRADVTIDVERETEVYVILGSDAFGYKDPRHEDMGYRSFEKPDLPEKSFDEWDKHRISLTIPDGSRDLIPHKSTLSEGKIDTLNGVSYDKGCYVGQELTARMHYRGLAKKHLYTVNLNDIPDKAELRSSCGDIGIALLKNG